jgi:hypothetical protein
MGRLAAVVTLSLFVHVQMGGTLGVPGGTGAAAASTARTVYFPPLTGHDMIEFLDKNADRLRVTLADYDGLYAFSKSVGDRPLIQAMRRNLTAEETAAEEAPKVSKAPETP